jgi:TP901 family phage tail tape measure protein
MGAIRTLYTDLKLRAADAVKGLKAYDKLWKTVEKSVAASATAIERSSDRAVAALTRMGDVAAVARAAGAGAGGGGRGGGAGASGGASRGGGGGGGSRRSGGQSSPVIDNIVARGAKSSAAMGGLAAGAKTINDATAALGRFATAEDRAKAKVADLTAQVQRNREEMARLRRQAVETGDADGTLTARMRGLAAQTGVTTQQLAKARVELRGVTGGLIDAVKGAANFRGALGAVQVAAGNLISGGLSRLAGAAAGALGESAKMAMNFEKSLVDVAKVAKDVDLKDGLLDPRIKQGIKDTAKELGVMPEQVAALTAQVTASFSGKTDIVALAKDVTKIGVAWDITGQQAGEYFKQTSAGLQLNANETKALFGSINQLGNELGIRSSEIAEAMTRSAGVIKGANLSGETGAALNATLIKAGASAEVAATGVRTFIARLGAGEAATDKQRKAFTALGLSAESVAKNLSSGDAARAEKQIKDVVAALVEMGEKAPDKRLATLIELFGSESIGSIGAAATATETLASAFSIAGDKAAALTSVQSEYERVSNTTAARVEKLKANIGVLAIEFGEALLPHIDRVVAFLTSPEGQEWGKGAVEKATGAVVGLAEIVGTLVGFFGDLSDKIGGAENAITLMGIAILALMGPIGIVTAALVGMLALNEGMKDSGKELEEMIAAGYGPGGAKDQGGMAENLAAFRASKAKAGLSKSTNSDDEYERQQAQNGLALQGGRSSAYGEQAERGGVVPLAGDDGRRAAGKIAAPPPAAPVGGDKVDPAAKAADMSRFDALVRMRNADPDGLDPAEAKELRGLSKRLNRAIPKKPGKGRTHKQTKMDKQLAAIDPMVRDVLTRGGDKDKGGDLKVADNALDRALFAKQNKANGLGGSSGGLGGVGPGPNITNNYTYVTTNVGGISVDARGNADAASNLSSSAREVGERVGEVRWTGANAHVAQRNAGGVRRGPA